MNRESSESPVNYVQQVYPEYMYMIRAFISEGIIEADEPSERQYEWAHRAALGDPELERVAGLLARVTEQAFKQRYLEGMPMLIDLDSADSASSNDFNPVQRFHFLRLLAKDMSEFESITPNDNFPDLHPVLYYIEEES